jgi:hypothetical protein
MKYPLLFLILPFMTAQLWAQCPLSDTTIYRNNVDSIRRDIDRMYKEMDTMNQFFYPLIQLFDSVKDEYNDPVVNNTLHTLIHNDSIFIERLKEKLDSQYLRRSIKRSKLDTIKYDQACLYYKTHKEIEDFKYSIALLQNSMSHLVVNDLISTISSVRFLNSYYYMSICRSLLLARMNNLENDIELFREYKPYPPVQHRYGIALAREERRPSADENQNKMTLATDELMAQTRKGPRNWFLKSVAAGTTGALIVYVLASLIRGHK